MATGAAIYRSNNGSWKKKETILKYRRELHFLQLRRSNRQSSPSHQTRQSLPGRRGGSPVLCSGTCEAMLRKRPCTSGGSLCQPFVKINVEVLMKPHHIVQAGVLVCIHSLFAQEAIQEIRWSDKVVLPELSVPTLVE